MKSLTLPGANQCGYIETEPVSVSQLKAVKGKQPVKEPWSRIISYEPNHNIISHITNVDNVSSHRILVVVDSTTSTLNDIKGVLITINSWERTANKV